MDKEYDCFFENCEEKLDYRENECYYCDKQFCNQHKKELYCCGKVTCDEHYFTCDYGGFDFGGCGDKLFCYKDFKEHEKEHKDNGDYDDSSDDENNKKK